MSAEVESIFYYGESPWHKQGKEVLHALTAEEAIIEAGLNWEVDMAPLYHRWQGNRVKIEHKVGTRRLTDGRILGIVSPEYQPVQNRMAFGFFDSVVGTGEAKYHTAGSLRNGQKIWMLAKVGDSPLSIKGDAVDKYLLLMNGHDGTHALKMFFTPVRVVCMNTLMAAEASARRVETFYAKHFGNVTGRMEQAREILGMTTRFFENFQEQAMLLAERQLPAPEFPKLLAVAFGTTGAIRPEDVINLEDIGSTRKVNELVKIERLFDGEGKGLNEPGIRGTKWAAYNAVAEYCDYGRQYRGRVPEDNRLEDVWLGTIQRIKNRAWNYLIKT